MTFRGPRTRSRCRYRHAHALRIQEALEEEVELDRIDVGDAEGVGDEAPRRRAAARSHAHAVLTRVVDEVAHDQEVARVADLADRVELVLEATFDLLGDRSWYRRSRPFASETAEVHLLALELGRDREGRKLHALGVERELAALRHDERVGERLRRLAEERLHLVRRLHVELVGREAEAVLVEHRLPVWMQRSTSWASASSRAR
jgi:hypothetical protein